MADSSTIIPKGHYRVCLRGVMDYMCQLEILDGPAKGRRIWASTCMLLPDKFTVSVEVVEDIDGSALYNYAHRVEEKERA